jgi:hypothetical protein
MMETDGVWLVATIVTFGVKDGSRAINAVKKEDLLNTEIRVNDGERTAGGIEVGWLKDRNATILPWGPGPRSRGLFFAFARKDEYLATLWRCMGRAGLGFPEKSTS